MLGLIEVLGAGYVCGLGAATALRSHGLHWSWSAATLPLIPSSWSLGSAAGLFFSVAAIVATTNGARWHRLDGDSGGELARAAAARRGPLDLLLAQLRRSRRGGRPRVSAGGLLIGEDEAGAPVRTPLGGRSGAHYLVVGATGSGKTVTQTRIAACAIAEGHGFIGIDPKGDPSLEAGLRAIAEREGRPFVLWSPEGPAQYNPYARGSDTEIADKALAGERYTEPHYLRLAQRYLGHELRTLRAAGLPISLSVLVDHLDPGRLESLARTLPGGQAEPLHRYLDGLTARQQRDLAGTRDRLAVLAESDAGRWLDPGGDDVERLELADAVSRRAVVLFQLQADRLPLLAQMLAAAIVQDLLTVASSRNRDPFPTLVVIDEFAALAAVQVARLFGRARSAGFSLVLASQELADLRGVGGPTLVDQVLGNITALVAHRQVVPESAELVARIAGERETWRATQRLAPGFGRGAPHSVSRTRVREPVVQADRITSLPTGWALVVVPASPAPASVTRILREPL